MNWTLQLKHYQTNDKLIRFENGHRGMVTPGMLEYRILRFPHMVNCDKMQVGEQVLACAISPVLERCDEGGNSKYLELIVVGKKSNVLKERGTCLNQPIIKSRHSVKARNYLFQQLRKTLSPIGRWKSGVGPSCKTRITKKVKLKPLKLLPPTNSPVKVIKMPHTRLINAIQKFFKIAPNQIDYER